MSLRWPAHAPSTLSVHDRAGAPEVHVWATSLNVSPTVRERYRSSLSADETTRADRFIRSSDRDAFVASHGMMRHLLGAYTGCDPAALSFTDGKYGKPSLCGRHGLQFNMSHSGALAVLAVTAAPDVGVDIERLRPVDDLFTLAERFLSVREVAALQALPTAEVRRGFFNAWTRKEAFVKGLGRGLSLPLRTFDVTLTPGEPARLLATRQEASTGRPWTLRELNPAPDVVGALAVPIADPLVRCFSYLPPAT